MERLLSESKLTLAKTDEICRAAESMVAQQKVVEDSASPLVSAIKSNSDQQQATASSTRECWNCANESYAPHTVRHAISVSNNRCQMP